MIFNETAFERFWSRVDKNGPIPGHRPDLGKCWVWKTPSTSRGYGMFKPSSYEKDMFTHRVSWVFAYGNIPDGLFVLHRCDRKTCVNPVHLRLGDRGDNARDMAAKFRGSHARLTAEEVRGIRQSGAVSIENIRFVAKEYRVSTDQVKKIVAWKTHKCLDTDYDSKFITGSDAMRPEAMDGSQIVFEPMVGPMDLAGQVYGRLTVQSYVAPEGNSKPGKNAKWICLCSCGKASVVRTCNLRSGQTRSCGCLMSDAQQGRWHIGLFWKYINCLDGHWIWKGAKSLHYKGDNWTAQRLSWFLRHGSLPPNKIKIRRRCAIQNCINPDCLYFKP